MQPSQTPVPASTMHIRQSTERPAPRPQGRLRDRPELREKLIELLRQFNLYQFDRGTSAPTWW